MSSFTNKLTVTQLSKNQWRLEKGFRYYVGEENSSEFVDVPDGFLSDGSSIPKIFWSIVGHPMGETAQCGFLHDFLYQKKIYSRKKSDQIFLESMQVLGVPLWKRRIMFRALRICGWVAWRQK